MPEAHRRVIPNPPPAGEQKAQARVMLKDFASRAWRRPASDEEAERLAGLVDLVMGDGENFATGMQVALQAVLSSPNFLFRWELDDRPAAGEGEEMEAIGPTRWHRGCRISSGAACPTSSSSREPRTDR